MSGTTLDTNSIPPIASMDADKEDGTHQEGPVANASPSITATSDNSISTNIPDADVPTSASVTTPLQQPTTTTMSTDAVPTETTHHQTSTPQRLPYKYDPDKITLRFLFANRDGLTVTVSCNPSDTIGEVKGVLISIWPKDVPNCEDGDDLRLICMGKGFLSPDSRTLQDCQIPIFKTHPTPVNVSVKPNLNKADPAAENAANHKHHKRNQQHVSNTPANSHSSINHHTTNVNNSNTNSNNNTSGSHPRTTATTTNRLSSNPNSPIETGQGCCIIS